ncbi:hypothetical protein WMF27_28220 [Sorangium sp. So ce281]|uniref:hypothetical protein n=1 Tax=unclassified Sorangium TaxID=2621164 RepID=UPI003F5E834E
MNQAELGEEDLWLALDERRTDAERAFITEMSRRALAWRNLGVTSDDLLGTAETFVVLMLDVSADGGVLRTLRVDFHESRVVIGEDETKQAATDLDEENPRVLVVKDGSPVALATAAADWMEREILRPIERHEWVGAGFWHQKYVLSDTGEPLCWSDSHNQNRPDLGPPDRTAVVRSYDVQHRG